MSTHHYLLSVFEGDTPLLLTVWEGVEDGSKAQVSGDFRVHPLSQNILPKSASSHQGQQVTQQTVYMIHIGASQLSFSSIPQASHFHKGTSTGETRMASLCHFPTFPSGRITAQMNKHGRKSGLSFSDFPPTETQNPGLLVHEGNELRQALPRGGRC